MYVAEGQVVEYSRRMIRERFAQRSILRLGKAPFLRLLRFGTRLGPGTLRDWFVA